MPSFVPRVNNFFSFRESFSRRPSVVFSRREERLCSPSLSKSTTFFRSVKVFVSLWSQSFFFNRGKRLCSPLLPESTTFFRSVKLFVPPWCQSFPQGARSVYAPPRFESQPVFLFPRKFVSLAFPWSVFPSSRSGNLPQSVPSVKQQTQKISKQCSGIEKFRQWRGFQPTAPPQA